MGRTICRGGGNLIDKIDGNRIGADSNEFLIKALELIRDKPNDIPDLITEDDYNDAKANMSIDGLTGFIGFAMSFGGKWFGGYRRDIAGSKGCIENMKVQTLRSKNSAIKQSPKLQGVKLIHSNYDKLIIPNNSIVYCDPPYKNTTKYKDSFDHDKFWNWVRKISKQHTVFISEYNAPEDFECIWSKEIVSSLTKDTGSKKGVEKLFKIKS